MIATGWVGGTPRVFAPVFLKLGALNEVYVWDEAFVGPFTVEVRRGESRKLVTAARGVEVDRPLPVLGRQNKPLQWSAALVSLDAYEIPGPVVVRFLTVDGRLLSEISSEIRPRRFPEEDIGLDPGMSELRAKPDPRKDREAVAIWKIYQKFEPRLRWSGGRFLLPVGPQWPTSAQFGDLRIYHYSDGTTSRDYHHGTDFAVPVGTPVASCASGTVAFTADRMLTGKTVVVAHAPGVYSVFFHLSKILVSPGQTVGAGDPIALSGDSGLVTGPHLHWEIRVDGVPVDPLDFVTDGLLDTNIVGAVISSIESSIH